MEAEKLSKKEVRDLYIKNQRRATTNLPIPAEVLSESWYKSTITVKELWNLNPQFYVGYRLNQNSKTEDDSGYLTYQLWRQGNYNSKAQSIVNGFKILKENNVYSDSRIRQQVKKITSDLGKLPLEHEDLPIILLNSEGIVPYSTGNTIDGVRRLIAMFDLYQNGDLQDCANVNIIVGNYWAPACLAYNAAAAILDDKPWNERVELLAERSFAQDLLFSESID